MAAVIRRTIPRLANRIVFHFRPEKKRNDSGMMPERYNNGGKLKLVPTKIPAIQAQLRKISNTRPLPDN